MDGLGVGERLVARDLEQAVAVACGECHVVEAREVADRLDARGLGEEVADVLVVAAVPGGVHHRVDVAVEPVAVAVVAVDGRALHVHRGAHRAQLHPVARLGCGRVLGADAVFGRAEVVGGHRPAAEAVVVLLVGVEGALRRDVGPVRLAGALHADLVGIREVGTVPVPVDAGLVPHGHVHLAVHVRDSGHDRRRRRIGARGQRQPGGNNANRKEDGTFSHDVPGSFYRHVTILLKMFSQIIAQIPCPVNRREN